MLPQCSNPIFLMETPLASRTGAGFKFGVTNTG